MAYDIPQAGAFDAPVLGLGINESWMPIIGGVIAQLTRRNIWRGDESEQIDAVRQVEAILRHLYTIEVQTGTGGDMSQNLISAVHGNDTNTIEFNDLASGGYDAYSLEIQALSSLGNLGIRMRVNDISTASYQYSFNGGANTFDDSWFIGFGGLDSVGYALQSEIRMSVIDGVNSGLVDHTYHSKNAYQTPSAAATNYLVGRISHNANPIDKLTITLDAGVFTDAAMIRLYGVTIP